MAYDYVPQQYGGYPTYVPQQYQNPAQPRQAQQPAGFSCRPVTSREEAIAAQTDYFSAGLIMPELSKGMVYLKRFNPQTGTTDFYDFQLVQPEQKPQVQYVTLEEFNSFKASLLQMSAKEREAEHE